jgi:hypothetical protein
MCGHHYFSKKPVSYNSYVYLCIQRNEERSMITSLLSVGGALFWAKK